MELYKERTSGSSIEEKVFSISWQYSNADPDFGDMQSRELEDHLNATLKSYPVNVLRGEGGRDSYIEVRLRDISKGHFLRYVVRHMIESNLTPDFCMVIGDDSSDEPMFEALDTLDMIPQRYSVTVGRKPSSARSFIDSVDAVGELLGVLGRVSIHETHSRSLQMISGSELSSGKAIIQNAFTGQKIEVDLSEIGSSRSQSCLELGKLASAWDISIPDLQALQESFSKGGVDGVSIVEKKEDGNEETSEEDGKDSSQTSSSTNDSSSSTQSSSKSKSKTALFANLTPRYSWLFDSTNSGEEEKNEGSGGGGGGKGGFFSNLFKRSKSKEKNNNSNNPKDEDEDGLTSSNECQTFLQFTRSQVGLALEEYEYENTGEDNGSGEEEDEDEVRSQKMSTASTKSLDDFSDDEMYDEGAIFL